MGESYFWKCKEGSRKPGPFSANIYILYEYIYLNIVMMESMFMQHLFFHLSVLGKWDRQLNMSNKWKLRVSFPEYLVPSKEWYVPPLYKGCFVRDEPSRVINLDGPFRCGAWPGYYLCLMRRHMVHLVPGHFWSSAPNPSKALLWKHKLVQSLDW